MVSEILSTWVACMFVSAACAFLRDVLFGMTSQRIGTRVRQRLFEAVIKKDVSFFDDNRTGDIRKSYASNQVVSRISSDTQVVQDGLSSSVAMFCKHTAVCVGMIIIMFTYSVRLTFFAILMLTPALFSNRIFFQFFRKFNIDYQKGKADMAAIAGESFSNVRVVKAFAEEDGSVKRFKHYNDRVYAFGLKKGYIWGANMFFFSTLR